MKVIKRLFVSLTHQLDGVLASFENHEALSTAAIREAKESLAKGKVHLHRINRDGEALRARIKQLSQEIILWEERAKESAETNHANALECIKRRKQSTNLLKQLEVELSTHVKVENQLKLNLQEIEEKISEYERKRNVLKTRASRAHSAAELQNLESECSPLSLNETLTRWEDQIAEQEFLSCTDASTDTFESSYTEKEETSALEAELALLLEQSTNTSESKVA